eukprot:SAG25_NODE_1052_length_4176_cov_3.711813_2_plen_588_part_00
MHECSLCNIYNPCDRHSCAARPDKIRNAQHSPFLVGVLLALLSNGYIIYSYLVDEKLRHVTITSLLAWAAIAEIFFCFAALAQELSFRSPNPPCIPAIDDDVDGKLDFNDCNAASPWHGWPTWAKVYSTIQGGHDSWKQGKGLRGEAINGCFPMAMIFQLTWTAAGSFVFMISVDLLLNLYASPFSSASRRWIFYQGWTWALSITLALVLAFSGEWGVSHDSILEDFCWDINFGRRQKSFSDRWLTVSHIVYTLMVAYPCLSLVVVVLTHCKMKRLTTAQRQTREDAILEGRLVVACSTVWLAFIAVGYRFGVLPESERITESMDIQNFKMDYDPSPDHWLFESVDKTIVQLFAFVLGGHSVVNVIMWLLVARRRHKRKAAEAGPGTQELQEVLQNEVLFFTGLGVRAAARARGDDSVVDDAPIDASSSESVTVDRLGSSSMYPPRQLSNAGAPSAAAASGGQFTTEALAMDVHRETEKRLNMKASYEWERANSTPFFNRFEDVFGQQHINSELDRQLINCDFKTYRPDRFRELRELFGVDQPGAGGAESLLHEAMGVYKKGSFTGGASGAFMYQLRVINIPTGILT